MSDSPKKLEPKPHISRATYARRALLAGLGAGLFTGIGTGALATNIIHDLPDNTQHHSSCQTFSQHLNSDIIVLDALTTKQITPESLAAMETDFTKYNQLISRKNLSPEETLELNNLIKQITTVYSSVVQKASLVFVKTRISEATGVPVR